VIACATLLLDIVDGLRMGQLFHPPVKMVNVFPFNWRHETWTMGSAKMIAQIVANILMFVPLGFLLPVVFPKLRRCIMTLACILLTSLSIEILQYYIGRSADIDDLIQNFTGGAIGYLLFYILSLVFRQTRFWQKALGIIR
jgi:glycopeptide antibiotics resistance protein